VNKCRCRWTTRCHEARAHVVHTHVDTCMLACMNAGEGAEMQAWRKGNGFHHLDGSPNFLHPGECFDASQKHFKHALHVSVTFPWSNDHRFRAAPAVVALGLSSARIVRNEPHGVAAVGAAAACAGGDESPAPKVAPGCARGLESNEF
jgi:hypothetical protein